MNKQTLGEVAIETHSIWVQQQAPAGNFYDSLGTDSMKDAKAQAIYIRSKGGVARIVRRIDVIIGNYPA